MQKNRKNKERLLAWVTLPPKSSWSVISMTVFVNRSTERPYYSEQILTHNTWTMPSAVITEPRTRLKNINFSTSWVPQAEAVTPVRIISKLVSTTTVDFHKKSKKNSKIKNIHRLIQWQYLCWYVKKKFQVTINQKLKRFLFLRLLQVLLLIYCRLLQNGNIFRKMATGTICNTCASNHK